jgi:hypothetical protein
VEYGALLHRIQSCRKGGRTQGVELLKDLSTRMYIMKALDEELVSSIAELPNINPPQVANPKMSSLEGDVDTNLCLVKKEKGGRGRRPIAFEGSGLACVTVEIFHQALR